MENFNLYSAKIKVELILTIPGPKDFYDVMSNLLVSRLRSSIFVYLYRIDLSSTVTKEVYQI